MIPTIKVVSSLSDKDRLIPVFSDEKSPWRCLPAALQPVAVAVAKRREFAGRGGETLLIADEENQWLFTGLGKREKLTRPALGEALGKGLAELGQAGADKTVGVLLPGNLTGEGPWTAELAARYAAEGLCMAGYAFNEYKSKPTPVPQLNLCVEDPDALKALRAGAKSGQAVAQAVGLARDLINHPAAVAHPGFLLEQAKAVAKQSGARFSAIVGDALLKQGYHAIHAVGQASAHPSALVVLEYGKLPGGGTAGGGKKRKAHTLALVGKGVSFDTGGLDIKPGSAMALMKKDMGGAATVLGAFAAIAALKLPLHVVAVLGLVENVVDAKSFRPGDILRSKQGTTIEITNTDAEGRVVLADAFALARTYRPDTMVDMATLTGACRVALGKGLMGLFCDDEALRKGLEAAAAQTGDMVWPLPLWQPYAKMLHSPVADLANAASEGFAGAITAALFLKEFAGDTRWAHLDCYAWSDGDHPLFPKGGSGVGVRLLAELAAALSE